MKKIILFLIFIIAAGNAAIAQKVPYRVVFDVTSQDTVVHQMVMRWVSAIVNSVPDAQIEIVYYAKSLDMISKNKSVVANDVINYAAKKNVSFKVCEEAMKRNGVAKDQLLTGVTTVADGIYEIISRQHEGWGYIKAAR